VEQPSARPSPRPPSTEGKAGAPGVRPTPPSRPAPGSGVVRPSGPGGDGLIERPSSGPGQRPISGRPTRPGPGGERPTIERPGGAGGPKAVNRPPTRPGLKESPGDAPTLSPHRPGPGAGDREAPTGARFGRAGSRADGPHGGGHDDGSHGWSHHPNWKYAHKHGIHYGGRPYSCHFDHGHHYRHWDWGWGLWISFRGVPWYYCPTYRSHTYVYVSTVYESHYYFGAGTGLSADRAVALVDTGWRELERGSYDRARRTFAEASAQAPDWGLPKIGYALSLAGSGHDRAAGAVLRLAMSEDPYAALEIPWSDELGYLLEGLDARYSSFGQEGVDPANTWFMAAAMRLMLGDSQGASEAAFQAEASGAPADAIAGLYDVLTATENAPPGDAAPGDGGYEY